MRERGGKAERGEREEKGRETKREVCPLPLERPCARAIYCREK